MGAFDDLIPGQPAAAAAPAAASSGGAFDDLVPPSREKELRAQYLKDQLQSGAPGYTARLKDSATMGLMRPIGGLMRGVSGAFDPTSTFGERYRAGVGAEEDYVKEAEKNTNPYLGAAVEVLGGLGTAGPAGGALKGAAVPVAKTVAVEAPSKVEQLAKVIATGAGQGAVEGAARNAESLPNAATGAAVGGTIGGATSGVVGGLTSRLAGKAAKEAVTEATERGGGSAAVKEAGGEIYKKLDDANIKFKDASPLVKDTIDTMKREGFNPAAGIHGDLVPIADRIGKLNGKETSWNELQQIREQLSAVKASDNKQARRMAGHLSDTLDEFIDTAKPTIPINKIGTVSPGDPAKARDLWRRGSQGETVEFLEKKGMAAAADPNRKLQTNFGSELDRINNPKRFSAFQNSPEQKAQIEKLAVGNPTRAALASFLNRQGGNLLGYGGLGLAGGAGANYLGDTTGIGGIGTTGGAASLGLGLLGKGGARMLNRGIAKRGGERVNDLIRNIVTGDTKKGTANVSREALAKVLAAEQLKRGASRYTSSKFDKE